MNSVGSVQQSEIFSFFVVLVAHMLCGILIPQPRIKPALPALKVWHLSHWTTREVPRARSCTHGGFTGPQVQLCKKCNGPYWFLFL